MKYNQRELCLIWLDSFIGLEYKHKIELYKKLNEEVRIKDFIQSNKAYITEFVGENNYNTLINSANSEYLNFVIGELNRNNIISREPASLCCIRRRYILRSSGYTYSSRHCSHRRLRR